MIVSCLLSGGVELYCVGPALHVYSCAHVHDFYDCDILFSLINAEFKRITTLPLQSRALSQLDVLSDTLLKVFEKRGGQIGQRLNCIMSNMTQVRINFKEIIHRVNSVHISLSKTDSFFSYSPSLRLMMSI